MAHNAVYDSTHFTNSKIQTFADRHLVCGNRHVRKTSTYSDCGSHAAKFTAWHFVPDGHRWTYLIIYSRSDLCFSGLDEKREGKTTSKELK